MPTAGKLIAAITFLALAYFVSDLVKPYLPEGTPTGLLSPLNALLGLLMGWRIVGARAGGGYYAASGVGLTGIVATTFWCLLLWAGVEMITRATRMRYDGPVEALQDMLQLMMEYALLAAKPDVIGAALIGAILCAWVAEFFAQRWS